MKFTKPKEGLVPHALDVHYVCGEQLDKMLNPDVNKGN